MGRQRQQGKRSGGFHISQTLVNRAIAGEPAAQEELWQLLMSRVCNLTRSLGKRKGLPQPDIIDTAQEVLLRLVRQPEQLRNRHSMGAWLYTVVNRALIDAQRRLGRSHSKPFTDISSPEDDTRTTIADLFPGQEDDPAFLAHQREVLEEVQTFLGSLTKDQQVVFRLYRQGLTHKQIAERTNLPLHSVNNAISRTKIKLWQLLDKWGIRKP